MTTTLETKKSKIIKYFKSSVLQEILINHLIKYPTPQNLNYF